jgi:Dyp-type peroxidase family
MSTTLDLHDIQGNILKAYGRYGYPKGRYFFFRVHDAEEGRRFVRGLVPDITTSTPWSWRGTGARSIPKPAVTTNVAFTYHGLRELGVPRDSLQSFPDEFAMGMKSRRDILGDDGASDPAKWDPLWRDGEVHILVCINGTTTEVLEEKYRRVVGLLQRGKGGGVELIRGHRGPGGQADLDYQDASALYVGGQPTPREHFGYTDGISNPFFKGMEGHESNVMGGGKVTGRPPETPGGWEPLETGEFLLGYKDEASEYPEAPSPTLLARNGTFLVYRKLHQNVGAFDAYLDRVGKEFPGGKEALAAKFAGRWRNGAPITAFPTEARANEFAEAWQRAKAAIGLAVTPEDRREARARFADYNLQFTAFDYGKDLDGGRCPMGAHIRRANPRGALEQGRAGAFETPGALSNRRRILRRGLPYGDSSERADDGDHGVIFMAMNASIRRQFEFVQQQWMNYANDFGLANDKDPLVGNHGPRGEGGDVPGGSMIIPSARHDPSPPFFCGGLPRFVETRGGDYFFVPSLTAVRMIGDGSIDPT